MKTTCVCEFTARRPALNGIQRTQTSFGSPLLGEPRRTIRRGGAGTGHSASHSTRVPAGHPEGYLESFAQLYSDLSEQIIAKQEGRQPEPESLLAPGVSDGVDGVRFIMAVLESSRHNSAWTRIPASL